MEWGRIKIEVTYPPKDDQTTQNFALGKVIDLLPDTNSGMSHSVVLPSNVGDIHLTAGMLVVGRASFEMPTGRDLTNRDIVLDNFSIVNHPENS